MAEMTAIEIGSLCLSRKVGEAIRIGDDIEIEIVRAQSGKARVRIRAPKQTRVMRAELPPKPPGCVA